MQNADIAALWDAGMLNAGFLVVRPFPLSQQLYEMVREITSRRRISDQTALNKAIRMLKRRGSRDGGVLRVNVLDRNQFLSGVAYFEKSGTKFPKLLDGSEASNKSIHPLVIHNNWIVGKEAKVYRFREHLMWLYDGHDQYYTSETRKYLTYVNAKPNTSNFRRKDVTERELSTLKTALAIGHLFNRVVILPIFHCGAAYQQCPLNSIVHIKTFDLMFAGRYRESSFLRHPKVPDSVKQGSTNSQLILDVNQTSDVSVSSADIMRFFNEQSAKVLNISNLQRVRIIGVDNGSAVGEFSSILQTTFRRSRYRQLKQF